MEDMMEKVGIESLKEVLAIVELLGVAAKSAMKDGKVSVADLPILVGLVPQLGMLVKAVEDAKALPAEIKDIDAAEAQELLVKLVAVVNAIKAA